MIVKQADWRQEHRARKHSGAMTKEADDDLELLILSSTRNQCSVFRIELEKFEKSVRLDKVRAVPLGMD